MSYNFGTGVWERSGFICQKGTLEHFHDFRVAVNGGVHSCTGYFVAMSSPKHASHAS